MTSRLTPEEVERALPELGGWTRAGEVLTWERNFASFGEAFAFTARVALLAERHDHHPDFALSYTRLTLRLTSHDTGGLTARDLRFARALSALV
jgi:4a-hydroxytetrahydrobiopterin dehydratase